MCTSGCISPSHRSFSHSPFQSSHPLIDFQWRVHLSRPLLQLSLPRSLLCLRQSMPKLEQAVKAPHCSITFSIPDNPPRFGQRDQGLLHPFSLASFGWRPNCGQLLTGGSTVSLTPLPLSLVWSVPLVCIGHRSCKLVSSQRLRQGAKPFEGELRWCPPHTCSSQVMLFH